MKQLLLSAALSALAVPAYASVATISGCAPGTDWCVSTGDSDDLKMFIDKPKVKGTPVFGSVGTNDNGLKDIAISPTTVITDGSGFANIKPAKNSTLESVTLTPSVALDQQFDGFFTSAQLEDNYSCKGKSCAPDTSVPDFFMTVNGSAGTATFEYDLKGFNGNNQDNGFDEPAEFGAGDLIKSVTIWIDTTGLYGAANPDVSFKELKQMTWSPCAEAECTTGGVPEPSTWAMMVLGFAGLGYAAFRQGRKTSTAIA
jgi:hypothetical protein